MDAYPNLYFLLDSRGTVLDFKTSNAIKLFRPSEDFIGKQLQHGLPQEVGMRAGACIDRVLATGTVENFQYKLTMEGLEQHYEARMLPVKNGRVLAIVRDITGLKQIERTIQGQEEELRRHRDSLEERVRERTAELVQLNGQLQLEIAERRQAEMKLEERTHELMTLLEMSNQLVSTLDLESLLGVILDQLRKLVEFDTSSIFMVEYKFSTWSVRIASNLCLDILRKRKVNAIPIDFIETLSRETDTPEARYLRKERRMQIRQAIAQLPEKYRALIVLYHEKGANYKEMSEILGKPMSIIKNRLYRARLMLKDQLEALGEAI
jgi:RNA polymerase sigma factor (sigma-70 family)